MNCMHKDKDVETLPSKASTLVANKKMKEMYFVSDRLCGIYFYSLLLSY